MPGVSCSYWWQDEKVNIVGLCVHNVLDLFLVPRLNHRNQQAKALVSAEPATTSYIYICVFFIYIYIVYIYIYNDNGSSPIKPPFVCRSRFLNATAFIRLGYILYLQRIKHVNGKYQMYPHVYRNLYWMNLSKLYPCTNPVCKVCSHVFPFTKKHCVSFITTWFWPRKSSRLPRPCHLALGPRPEVF